MTIFNHIITKLLNAAKWNTFCVSAHLLPNHAALLVSCYPPQHARGLLAQLFSPAVLVTVVCPDGELR